MISKGMCCKGMTGVCTGPGFRLKLEDPNRHHVTNKPMLETHLPTAEVGATNKVVCTSRVGLSNRNPIDGLRPDQGLRSYQSVPSD